LRLIIVVLRRRWIPNMKNANSNVTLNTEVFDKIMESWTSSESNDETFVKCSPLKQRPYCRVMTMNGAFKEGRDINEYVTKPRRLRRSGGYDRRNGSEIEIKRVHKRKKSVIPQKEIEQEVTEEKKEKGWRDVNVSEGDGDEACKKEDGGRCTKEGGNILTEIRTVLYEDSQIISPTTTKDNI